MCYMTYMYLEWSNSTHNDGERVGVDGQVVHSEYSQFPTQTGIENFCFHNKHKVIKIVVY